MKYLTKQSITALNVFSSAALGMMITSSVHAAIPLNMQSHTAVTIQLKDGVQQGLAWNLKASRYQKFSRAKVIYLKFGTEAFRNPAEIEKASLVLTPRWSNGSGDLILSRTNQPWGFENGRWNWDDNNSYPLLDTLFTLPMSEEEGPTDSAIEIDVTETVKRWADLETQGAFVLTATGNLQIKLMERGRDHRVGQTGIKRFYGVPSLKVSYRVDVVTGPEGPQGERGPRGEKGEIGTKGPSGKQGPTGPPGPQGIPGQNGSDGAAGPKGDKGDAGPQGAKGDKGSRGEKGGQGSKGDRGPRGHKGPKGDPGAKGQIGQMGPEGAPGPMGPRGPEGPIGQRGQKGDRGRQGATGQRGAPGAIVPIITTRSTCDNDSRGKIIYFDDGASPRFRGCVCDRFGCNWKDLTR